MAIIPSQTIIDKPARWHAEFIDNLPVGIYRTTVEGKLIFCNRCLAKMFGFDSVSAFIGYPVAELYCNKKNRGDLIKAIMEKGYVEELCFPFKKGGGTQIWCTITAKAVFDNDGIMVFVDGIMRDVTGETEGMDAVPGHDGRERPTKEKLQGVLEMAGGVAHRLNQPLTIVNNLLDEVLSNLRPHDDNFQKIVRIRGQINKLNEIAKKIGGIRKYELMDYVGGIKIVDIDKAS
ncbi:MAG: PAS domain-containing protein [Deltaproteobacteria bacterium]|nr:PAS domain-containing protein [Deltaproteobacteria bacterium]